MSAVIDNVAYERGTKLAIIRNAQKTFLKTERNAIALEYAQENQSNPFMRSMVDNYENYGKLTEKQVDAILASKQKREDAAKARHETKIAESHYYFENGKRITLVIADCKAIGGYDTDYGFVHIYECTLTTGEKVIYKGTGFNGLFEIQQNKRRGTGLSPFSEMYVENATLTIKATIEHAEYNGVKQTMIKRPAVDKKAVENKWLLDN